MNTRAQIFIIFLFVFSTILQGQSQDTSDPDSPISIITSIYEDVSGSTVEPVDWEKVRSVFVEEAVIVLRTSRENTTRFTVDGFIQDFKNFYQNPAVMENGFREKVVKLESEVYKDMAFVWVVYEASIPNAMKEPQQGLDFWLLSREDNTWKVVAVTNEVIPPGESNKYLD